MIATKKCIVKPYCEDFWSFLLLNEFGNVKNIRKSVLLYITTIMEYVWLKIHF